MSTPTRRSLQQPHTLSTGIPYPPGKLACEVGDADAFFVEKGGNPDPAKALCKGGLDGKTPCPILDACLQWALDNREMWGIWGGLTERERRELGYRARVGPMAHRGDPAVSRPPVKTWLNRKDAA